MGTRLIVGLCAAALLGAGLRMPVASADPGYSDPLDCLSG